MNVALNLQVPQAVEFVSFRSFIELCSLFKRSMLTIIVGGVEAWMYIGRKNISVMRHCFKFDLAFGNHSLEHQYHYFNARRLFRRLREAPWGSRADRNSHKS